MMWRAMWRPGMRPMRRRTSPPFESWLSIRHYIPWGMQYTCTHTDVGHPGAFVYVRVSIIRTKVFQWSVQRINYRADFLKGTRLRD